MYGKIGRQKMLAEIYMECGSIFGKGNTTMTDKQIIIDGIDVSRCEFLIISEDKQMCRCIKSDLFGAIEFVENAKDGSCQNNANCYYKQLKRAENQIVDLNKKVEAKEQECEELKKWKETVVELFERTCRCKYLNEENNHCGFYNRKCIGRLNQCLYKNQQALTEIKEIAEKMKKLSEEDGGELTECFFRDKQCEKCSEDKCLPYWFAQILQKISEVLE